MAGLRDVLIHGYLRVNIERVWGIVEQNLPTLKMKVMDIAGQLTPSNEVDQV